MTKTVETKAPPAPGNDLRSRTAYPWESWSKDDTPRVFTRGKHFFVTPSAFVTAAYTFGRRKGYRVKSAKDGERVTLQFIKVNEHRRPSRSAPKSRKLVAIPPKPRKKSA